MSVPEGVQPDGGAARGEGKPARRTLGIVGAVVIVAIAASIAYAMAGTLGTTDSQRPGGGGDEHSVLELDTSAIVQTVDKAVVQVRIRSVEPEGLAFTATVAGLPEGETGTWTAILDDGSELPLSAVSEENSLVRVWLDGEVPGGRSIDEVRLDPDPSAGDLYFKVEE